MNRTPVIAQFFNCSIICPVHECSRRTNVRKKVKENDHTFPKISVKKAARGIYSLHHRKCGVQAYIHEVRVSEGF